MKNKKPRQNGPRTVTVSLGDDITQWLRIASLRRRISISAIVREALLPSFEARHTDGKRAI